MDTIVTIEYVPDQPEDVTDDPMGAQGVVGDAQSATHETADGSAGADVLAVAVLTAADMDYANGNTIKGEDLRRRYGLS